MKQLLLLLLVTAAIVTVVALPSKYHHYDDMVTVLQNTAERCSNVTKLYSIGKSVNDQDLWVLEFGGGGSTLTQPSVKVVGNIHGNEAVGREMALRLCEYICDNQGLILERTRIAILPSMNPDGFESGHRTNAHWVDLNRNFPDQFRGMSSPKIEPEVQAVMNWSLREKFTLSLTFHGGSLVANYPYDGRAVSSKSIYSECPDDELFRSLALAYSSKHERMYESKDFEQGITNGAAWYVLYGGMQDWNYLEANTYDVTVEISNRKWPPETELEDYWQENREAILNYISRVHIGVRGRLPPKQVVWVKGIEDRVTGGDENGEYIQLLAPEKVYTLHCSNNKTTQIHVRENAKQLIKQDFI